MSKIILFVEHVKNEIAFIKIVRAVTGKALIEIKNSLRDKKPIFQGTTTGSEEEDDLAKIKKILRFAKKEGEIIKIFLEASCGRTG